MIVTIAMRRRQSTLGPVCEPLKRRGMLGRSCLVSCVCATIHGAIRWGAPPPPATDENGARMPHWGFRGLRRVSCERAL